MRRAIKLARSKGSDRQPLGAVIVLDGGEIAAERNQTSELPDATAHAEMMEICHACEVTSELGLRRDALLDAAALRDVHHGVDLVQNWPGCSRRLAGGRLRNVIFEVRHVDPQVFVADAY